MIGFGRPASQSGIIQKKIHSKKRILQGSLNYPFGEGQASSKCMVILGISLKYIIWEHNDPCLPQLCDVKCVGCFFVTIYTWEKKLKKFKLTKQIFGRRFVCLDIKAAELSATKNTLRPWAFPSSPDGMPSHSGGPFTIENHSNWELWMDVFSPQKLTRNTWNKHKHRLDFGWNAYVDSGLGRFICRQTWIKNGPTRCLFFWTLAFLRFIDHKKRSVFSRRARACKGLGHLLVKFPWCVFFSLRSRSWGYGRWQPEIRRSPFEVGSLSHLSGGCPKRKLIFQPWFSGSYVSFKKGKQYFFHIYCGFFDIAG